MFKIPYVLSENCLSCSRYLICKDPHKSVVYKCNRYLETASSKDSAYLRLFDSDPTYTTSDKELDTGMPSLVDEEAFNIRKVISGAVKRSSVVTPDMKVDDGDFKLAPNFYKFCTSDKYLNEIPFLPQAVLGTIVFGEYCPDCSDLAWLSNYKVDEGLGEFRNRVQLLVRGKCKRCKGTKAEFVKDGKLNYYQEAAIVAGQRSGKSAWVAMCTAYITHWLMLLQNPNELYSLPSSNTLHGTFVALTYAQANDTLWKPYHAYLTTSTFYSQYNQMLDHYSNLYGERLYNLKDSFVTYDHRRLFVYPHGPDKRTLRGRTRCFGSLDELGWFSHGAKTTSMVKMSGEEVYIALERSLLTVRAKANRLMARGVNNAPTGYFINVSSPSSARDKIMELVRHSQGSRKIYGCVKPTWEMNPDVTREDLDEEFRKDPITAMRDYGAQPPLSSNPFITSKDAIQQVLSDKPNPCRIRYQTKKSVDGTATRYAEFIKLKANGNPSVLGIDAGFSNNSYACAVGTLYDGKYPIIDLLVEIQSLPGIPLNFSLIYTHIIAPLIEKRNVRILVADRWNSLKILHDAVEDYPNLVTEQISLKYPQMQVFKDYILDQQLNIPKPEHSIDEILDYPHQEYPDCFRTSPVDHAVLQLLTVQDTGSGVIKGDRLTDDLVRAMMVTVTALVNPNNINHFIDTEEEVESDIAPRPGLLAYHRGHSGGGSSRVGAAPRKTLGILKPRRN